MTKRLISLKDIAAELNVSISTVSRALRDHPDISPELTEKIKAVARAWNYSPNPLAMGLLKQQTMTIGVVVPDLVTYFYSSIISGIEQVARENVPRHRAAKLRPWQGSHAARLLREYPWRSSGWMDRKRCSAFC